MITDKIDKLYRYNYVPGVQKAIDFLANTDLNALEVGSIDLGDGCTVKVQHYKTKEEPEEVLLEAHREYLDLQMNYSGSETFIFQAIDLGEEAIPYDKKKDVEFFTAQFYNTMVLDSTNFVIVFPNDLHVGSLVADDVEDVKKLIFKLKI